MGQVDDLRLEMENISQGIFSTEKFKFVLTMVSAMWAMEHSFTRKESHLSLGKGFSYL